MVILVVYYQGNDIHHVVEVKVEARSIHEKIDWIANDISKVDEKIE